MKLFITKTILLLVLSVSFMSCAQNSNPNDKKETVVSLISPVELHSKIDNIQIIDIRTPREFTQGHLKNSININYYENNFLDEMSKLDKTKDVYIYCLTGYRSGRAAKKLERIGFTKVYDLKGGIINWNKNNLEIIR